MILSYKHQPASWLASQLERIQSMTKTSPPIWIMLKICPIEYSGDDYMETEAMQRIEMRMITLLKWFSGVFKIKLWTGGTLICFLFNLPTRNAPGWAKKYSKRIKILYFTAEMTDSLSWSASVAMQHFTSRNDGPFVLICNSCTAMTN